ncbi:MAG: ABC transporter permease subunit [Gemmataceae bacterium]|nr:ABC transporter permease subunit [Planctomycetia bacterium]MBX3399288.1 ABC transporter permease subunit [Gemmataceae bacterium]
MRPTLSLIQREFTAYFFSPIGFVTLAVFLLVTGRLFGLALGLLTEPGPRGTEFPMQTLLGDEKFWLVFLFIPPLLTMRLLAEERGTGTLESLMTAPIRDWQVVAGKYLACLLFYVVLWLPTLAYLPVLLDLDANWKPRIDPWPVVTSYVGAFFAGAMFLAIGLYVSSLVKSQLVAAMIAMILSLVFVVAAFWRPEYDAGSLTTRIVYFLSVPEHFRRDFTRGIVDTRHLVLYGSITLLCLFLTVRSLEARRLR